MVTVPISLSGSLKTTDQSTPSMIVNCRNCWLPNINLPSNRTISWDIKASFEKCQEHITKLLQEHPGHLHFTTDAFTSPNHCVFITWMVHLEYEGLLSFACDFAVLHFALFRYQIFKLQLLTQFLTDFPKVCTMYLPMCNLHDWYLIYSINFLF